MSVEKDVRRQRRIPYINPIRISWEDHGQPRFALAKCMDVSEDGMRIESPQPVLPGTRLMLRAERINYSGAATVKHVVRYGSKYFIGLQLAQPVHGKALSAIADLPPGGSS